MSKKAKEKKRQLILQKKIKRKRKREKKRKEGYSSLSLKDRAENLIAQLKEHNQPSFSRFAFQTSQPSDNTTSSTVKSAVLNSKPKTVGFTRGAWGPPTE